MRIRSEALCCDATMTLGTGPCKIARSVLAVLYGGSISEQGWRIENRQGGDGEGHNVLKLWRPRSWAELCAQPQTAGAAKRTEPKASGGGSTGELVSRWGLRAEKADSSPTIELGVAAAQI